MENMTSRSPHIYSGEALESGMPSNAQPTGQPPTSADKQHIPSLTSDHTSQSQHTSLLGDMTNVLADKGNDEGPNVIVVDDDIEITGEKVADEVEVIGMKRQHPPVSVDEDGAPPDKVLRRTSSSELRSVGEVESPMDRNRLSSTAPSGGAPASGPSAISPQMINRSAANASFSQSLFGRPSDISPAPSGSVGVPRGPGIHSSQPSMTSSAPRPAPSGQPETDYPSHRSSEVWKHFTDTVNSYGERRSQCNICKGLYVTDLSNLWAHYYRCVVHYGGFEKEEARRLICEWVIMHNVPLEAVCSNEYGDLIRCIGTQHLKPPTLSSLKGDIRTMYHKTHIAVETRLRKIHGTVHFSFDTWSGNEGEHQYLGVFAHYIDERWHYKEVLIRLIRSSVFLSAALLGMRMDKVFSRLGITGIRGPGTTQFKSLNNAIAAILGSVSDTASSEELVPCSCHIAIEAAKTFARWNGYLTDDEIDRIFAEENRDMEASRGDVQVAKPLADDEMEELQSNEEEDDLMLSQSATSLGKMTGTLKENELMNSTPLGRLNNLAVYIGESTWRTLEFDTIRMEKAQMAKDPLPRPTSLTSWKSIDTLISAALDLKESILAFCQVRQVKHPECPVVTGEDLEALRTFKSAFNVFYRLMNVFSSTEARVHLVIPVFHAAITELMQLESQCQLTDRPAFTTAIDKLMESVKIFLHNNWVCAAWALNPPVRGDNLRKTFGVFSADEFSRFELDLQHREEEVVQWIKRRMEKHNEALFERMPEVKTAYQAGTLSADPQWLGNPERQWSTYNRPDHSSWQLPNESILRYWRRQAERRDLHVLASVAKDILGLATSVSGVDHLVSTFNNLTSKGNASLSVSVAAEQSCLKAWLRQGVVPPLEKAQTSLT